MEYKEIEYEDFYKYIYSKKPQKPKTIQLEIEANDVNDLFKKLFEMLIDGIKYLFGNEENEYKLEMLTMEDLGLLNEYFHSFGVNIIFCMTDAKLLKEFNEWINDKTKEWKNEYNTIDIRNIIPYNKCESNELKDRRVTIDCNDMCYSIGFELI